MKHFRGLPLYVLLALLLRVSPGHAQIGTMKWEFRSRSEVISALKKTRGNFRNTYDVLICAGRQGYTNTSIRFYEDIISGHEFTASAQDSAAYAFAYDLGYSFRPWGWKKDLNSNLVEKSSRSTAKYFRDRAKSLRPNAPEVQIMRVLWGTTLGKEETTEAYKLALQSIKRAPRWADAYYWLGIATSNHANSILTRITDGQIKPNTKEMESARKEIATLGRQMLRAYDQAERLDPGMKSYLYWPKISAYQNIADKKSAQMIPVLVERHLRAYPEFGQWYQKTFGQSVAQFRLMYRDLAIQIARDAKS